ncbi:hypothetical protein [Nonlabens ponticola]|uniref:Uncharacterized protein n=1 Tax=Nonlabens ponticola TaxID=2496866 RepID=A0A3S9MWR8_9FLAO|nr:hypothetical protein [Nonlabens ponticola]AZQ43584.1 hypothetical protein EJ995_04800 [Nonlabens ponticola]
MRSFLLLIILACSAATAQIYRSELVIVLNSGEELYGFAKIPRGRNKPIKLTQTDTKAEMIIDPQDIEYILLDIMIPEKKGLFSIPEYNEERLVIVPLDIGTEKKAKWIYALEIVAGDLSYYGYDIRAVKKEAGYRSRFYGDIPSPQPDSYKFSIGNYLYVTLEGQEVNAFGNQGSFLNKNANLLMSDCPNLIEEIKMKKRFEDEEIKRLIEKYNEGCY